MAKILQLLRNTVVLSDFAAAKTKLSDSVFVSKRKDGEAVLARYTEGDGVKTALGLYHVNHNGKTGVTILQDSAAVQSLIDALQSELDTTQTSAGLNADGTYAKDTTEGSLIADATSILDADKKLAAAIKKEIEDREKAIKDLDDTDSETEGSVVVAVVQTDGQVKESEKKQAQALKLVGFTSTGDEGSLQIAATDTIGGAFNKIENYFKGLDVDKISATGQPIVEISQKDGKIAAAVGDIAATHVTVADVDNVITATNVEGALTEIAKKVNANKVSNTDKSIVVTEPTGEATTTDIKVNVKDGEKVIKLGDTGIYTDIELKKLTDTELATLADENVKEAYHLLDSNNERLGDVIKIYKDSSLNEVYLGSSKDTIDENTGTVTKDTTETDVQSLNFVYHLANGKYSLVKIDVSKFITESEYADGLQVTNHVISVKKDTASETVRTADGEEGLVDVISISANGIKISNIQKAIDYAINSLDKSDNAVAGEYVSQVVEANGLITVTRAEIGKATLNSYVKGTDSTAVTISDTVNSAIGKLENQVDKAKAAAKTVIDTTVTSSDETKAHLTITKENADDGHDIYKFTTTDIASEDALDSEVTRAKSAETSIDSVVGLTKATDGETRTYTNTGEYIGKGTTNTVASDIKALDNEVKNAINNITSANKGIVVGSKSSKSVELTLTLDVETTETQNGNQYVSNTGSNALQITEKGLYLSNVWDCGSY